jgi:uncharacterized protein YutE (UPF0331/DUF86 family)
VVDQLKLRQKIHYIREQMKNLQKLKELSREKFLTGPIYTDASLRELQVAIEAMIDICNHVVAREGWGLPKSYREGFEILTKQGVLEKEMLDTYLKMVKFRNRIVHIYDDIDSEEVYQIIQNNLGDLERFVVSILKKYF